MAIRDRDIRVVVKGIYIEEYERSEKFTNWYDAFEWCREHYDTIDFLRLYDNISGTECSKALMEKYWQKQGISYKKEEKEIFVLKF